jgi:hypothetical protein
MRVSNKAAIGLGNQSVSDSASGDASALDS